MKRENFLILTASVGSGHTRAAQAIREALSAEISSGVIVVDCMQKQISRLSSLSKEFYLRMLNWVPNLYDIFYRLTGGASGGRIARCLCSFSLYPGIYRLMKKHRPKTVICTHPFPAGAVAMYKKFVDDKIKLAVVLTDYSLHPTWLYSQVNFYFTATEEMRDDLAAAGFSPGIVEAVGIPIGQSIINAPSRAEARQKLKILDDGKVILIMGGGLGLGGMADALDDLENISGSVIVLVVTGKNSALRLHLAEQAKKSRHRVLVWGYTDEIPLLMSAADILLTKPGALTMSEAFALGLPLVLSEPIPGPEALNAKFAVDKGAAVWLDHRDRLSDVLRDLFQTPEKLTIMSEAALSAGRPKAAQEIARKLVNEI